jgi:ribosomal protein S18 acetylase RimI-like enzyme
MVDDIPAIAALIQAVGPRRGTFSGRPLADATTEHLVDRLGQILHQENRVLLVAADEAGEVAGMLAARSDDVGTIDLLPVLHVTHLMVAPAQRRRGIGRSLLAAAVHIAEDAGSEHVVATAAAGSREANRYLARIGFAPLILHRIAPTSVLRRSLGMTDVGGRMAVLRRARLVRAQRGNFEAGRAVGHGA